jgi:hypothetical protein
MHPNQFAAELARADFLFSSWRWAVRLVCAAAGQHDLDADNAAMSGIIKGNGFAQNLR